MNQDALSTYEQVQKNALDGRALEAHVLLKAARKLEWCAQHWDISDPQEFRNRLTEAIDFNQRLWTLFQVELLSPENTLAPEIRRNLLSLSQEVDRRSFILQAGGELGDVELLAKLNRSIAEGLQDEPATASNAVDSVDHETATLNVTA
jgi:flagellar protein FlaF